MKIIAGVLAAAVSSSFASDAEPLQTRPRFRCEVQSFGGAMSTGGGQAKMTVVSDGLGCGFTLWGVADARRNPATSGEVTEAPQHGTATFQGSFARYIAERDYAGPDGFAVRAVARDADNIERTMVIRVEVDVRAQPFDRGSSGNVAMLMPAGPVRVGNEIPVPRRIKDVRPVYPPDARAAGAQGVVVLDATIGADGKVSAARVTRSVPFLDAAAVAAVRQWEYAPTILDGRAVEVILPVNVAFTRADAAAPATASQPAPPSPTPAPPSPLPSPTPAPAPAAPPAPRPAPAAPRPAAAPPRAPSPDSDLEIAFDRLQRRQYEDALKAFRQANDRRGQKCDVCWLGMARAYEALGAAKNVIDACDHALAMEGSDKTLVVQARQLKAVALQDLGLADPKRLRDAEEELRAALALDSTANYLHFNLGVVLLREGRDADGVAELKAELDERPDSPHADRARQMIENPRRARESFAPAFSVVTLDREFIDLNALKGRVVLLDFWGTWCPPCVAAVPTLRSLQKRHAKDPFVLLSISSDNDEAVVRRFIEQNQIVWPQFWDRDRKVQQVFDVRAFPTYVVIDDEGVVRFRTTGGGASAPVGLDDAIRKQLKAAAGRVRAQP